MLQFGIDLGGTKTEIIALDEQGNEVLQVTGVAVDAVFVTSKQEQVDVGVRMQFRTAITAHCDQGDVLRRYIAETPERA